MRIFRTRAPSLGVPASVLVLSLLGAFSASGMGVRGAKTGAKQCNRFMCVTGIHDSSLNLDTYTLGPPDGANIPQDEFGWIAIGFGKTMANSPMVIVWPNTDGSFTLSQRASPGQSMPTVVHNPPRIASLSTAQTFANSTTTSISFTIPSPSTNALLNATDIIWAYSAQNPRSGAIDARLVQHAASGYMVLPLLSPLQVAPVSATASDPRTASSTSTPEVSLRPATITNSANEPITTSLSRHNHRLLVAHAVCGALATMVFLPLGVLISRYARGSGIARWWLPVHGAVNGVLGGVLVLVAYAIGRSSFHRHAAANNTVHRALGLALFILTLVQIGLGLSTHALTSRAPEALRARSGRSPINFVHMFMGCTIVHMFMGCTIVLMGWVQVYKGLTVEWPVWSGTGPPSSGWKAGWAVLVTAFSLAYIVGIAWLLPRQVLRERDHREVERRATEITESTDGGHGDLHRPVTPTKYE